MGTVSKVYWDNHHGCDAVEVTGHTDDWAGASGAMSAYELINQQYTFAVTVLVPQVHTVTVIADRLEMATSIMLTRVIEQGMKPDSWTLLSES